jgi:hypothetical protein
VAGTAEPTDPREYAEWRMRRIEQLRAQRALSAKDTPTLVSISPASSVQTRPAATVTSSPRASTTSFDPAPWIFGCSLAAIATVIIAGLVVQSHQARAYAPQATPRTPSAPADVDPYAHLAPEVAARLRTLDAERDQAIAVAMASSLDAVARQFAIDEIRSEYRAKVTQAMRG